MYKTNKFLFLEKKIFLNLAIVFALAFLFFLFSTPGAQAATTTPITDLTATPSSSTEISLTWTPTSDALFDHYELYRGLNSGVSTSTGTLIASTSATSTSSFADSGLSDGNQYWYKLYIFYDDGDIETTSPATSTYTLDYTNTAISDLNVFVSSSTEIMLFWTANSDPAYAFTHYEIYRSNTVGVGTTSTLIATSSNQSLTSFTDPGLTDGNDYFYKIYVVDNNDDNGIDMTASNETGATTTDYTNTAIADLTATTSTSTSITLSWTANSDPAYAFTHYEIYRSNTTGVSATSTLVTTSSNQALATYTDTGLSDGNDYFYKIYVVDNNDDNGIDMTASNETGATTTDYTNTAIADLSATASSSTEISLSWTANSDPAYAFGRYEIYRGATSGVSASSTLIATSSNQALSSYGDSGLSDGNDYFYKIYVVDNNDDNGIDKTGSNATSATTTDYSNRAVTNFSASASGDSKINLSWTANTDPAYAFDHYKIYRSRNSSVGTSDTRVAKITTQSTNSFSNTGISPNTLYYYRIYVYDTDDNGEDVIGSSVTSARTGGSGGGGGGGGGGGSSYIPPEEEEEPETGTTTENFTVLSPEMEIESKTYTYRENGIIVRKVKETFITLRKADEDPVGESQAISLIPHSLSNVGEVRFFLSKELINSLGLENGATNTIEVYISSHEASSEQKTYSARDGKFMVGFDVFKVSIVVNGKDVKELPFASSLEFDISGIENKESLKAYYYDTTNKKWVLAGDGGAIIEDRLKVGLLHLTDFSLMRPESSYTEKEIEENLDLKWQQILNDAKMVVDSGSDTDKIISYNGKTKDTEAESQGKEKYTNLLSSGSNLNDAQLTALNNFIVYGTKSTQDLGEGERAGTVNSYKAAFGHLPVTENEWKDCIAIGNGRWPGEKSVEAEENAKEKFREIYLREPNMSNSYDDAAVTVIAYGLRPDNRNMESEAQAIKIFRAIFDKDPEAATEWDSVRAIAYSGATREGDSVKALSDDDFDNLPDTDEDGLSDVREEEWGTDPNNPDTDGDGYNDGLEVDSGYNPLGEGKDFDRDGISDGREIELGLNPNDPDTDGDGYNDGEELNNGYNPLGEGLDSDSDMLSNEDEIAWGTNPYNPDTDGDGYLDGVEISNGYSPLE